jgi:hypothetical protein
MHQGRGAEQSTEFALRKRRQRIRQRKHRAVNDERGRKIICNREVIDEEQVRNDEHQQRCILLHLQLALRHAEFRHAWMERRQAGTQRECGAGQHERRILRAARKRGRRAGKQQCG